MNEIEIDLSALRQAINMAVTGSMKASKRAVAALEGNSGETGNSQVALGFADVAKAQAHAVDVLVNALERLKAIGQVGPE